MKVISRTCIAFLILLIIQSSCTSDNKADIKYAFLSENNFDSYLEWGQSHPQISNENSHSGKYSCITDSVYSYSITFSKNWYNNSDKSKYINVEFWVYCSDSNLTAEFVVAVDREADNLWWKGIDIKTNIKECGKWTKISETFELPLLDEKGSQFKAYLWNRGKSKLFIDDISISGSF